MRMAIVVTKNNVSRSRVSIMTDKTLLPYQQVLEAIILLSKHAKKEGFIIWRNDPGAIGGSHFEKEDGSMMYLEEKNDKNTKRNNRIT